jgi:carboxymethylenebutenolidase
MRSARNVTLFAIVVLAVLGITACAGPNLVRYESQGIKTVASVYLPGEIKKSAPGILLLHTAGGYSRHYEDVAAQLAEQGYIAMTMAYAPPLDPVALFKDEPRLRQLEKFIVDSSKVLRAQPGVDKDRLGVIGYSLGGYFVPLLLSGSQDIKFRAGVIYYGVFDIPAAWGEPQAPLLVLQGDKDKYPNFLPRSQALAARNKSVELVVYPGAMHLFDFDYIRDHFDPKAADDAWRRTLKFFEKHLRN